MCIICTVSCRSQMESEHEPRARYTRLACCAHGLVARYSQHPTLIEQPKGGGSNPAETARSASVLVGT